MNKETIFVLSFCLGLFTVAPALGAIDPSDSGCNAPAFYTTGSEPPNILFVVDKSGSMGWSAYNVNDYKGNEEGYFDPLKNYKYDSSDSTWKEVERYDSSHLPNLPAVSLVTSSGDSNDQCPASGTNVTINRSGSDGDGDYTFKGSCLNVHYMKRVDIARWALTGGTPRDCSGVTDVRCDPGHPLSGAISGGVIDLKPYYSSYGYVEVPEARIDGFIQAAEQFTEKPRMGVLFYDSSLNSDKVYLGDYPNGNDGDPNYPFTNLKRFINAKGTGSSTGTYYAMQEAYDYFKQSDDHSYSNDFIMGTGTYRDPLYRCDAGRSNCQSAGWCSKNYVILVSDGQWNSPDCNASHDPVQAAYNMHTEALRSIDGHSINVEKVYALGVFMGGTGVKSMRNIAMFGSFDLASDPPPTWPGGVSAFPTSSCTVDDCGYGSGSSCDDVPSPTFSDWDSTRNGDPDTFFAPQNALDLKLNLFSIFQDIISDVGASASVATVTQDVLGEDVVIRGAFRNNPLDIKIWEGHLESYWPVSDCLKADQTECLDPCTWDAGSEECLPYTFQHPENISNHRFCSDQNFHGGHCWDAHLTLLDPTSRDLFTYLNGVKVEISTANTAQLHPHLDNAIDFNGDGTVDIDDSRELIRWIRGEWDQGWSAGVRPKSGMLGDIVYSAPVVVGSPSLSSVAERIAVETCKDLSPCGAYQTADTCEQDLDNKCQWVRAGYCKGAPCSDLAQSACTAQDTCSWDTSAGICHQKTMPEICALDVADSCFYTYQYCNQYRKKVVYVGANDGMLHAFVVGVYDSASNDWLYDPARNSEIGSELWAYIPSNLLSEINCLAQKDYGNAGGCQHRTMVDLSSLAWDVTIGTTTGECNGTPSTVCGDYAASETMCVEAGCTWDCTGNYDCTALSYDNCATAPGCDQECSGALDCTLLAQADCNNVSGCNWGCSAGTDSCDSNTDYSSCSQNSNCNWECGGTTFACSDVLDRNLCQDAGCSVDGCYWENNHCQGSYDCSTLTQAACNNNWLCNWEMEEECRGTVSCAGISNRNTCNNRGCSWDEECEGDITCSAITSRWTCRNRGCTWSGGSCGGTAACSALNQGRCDRTPGCRYTQTCSGSPSCSPLRESWCNSTAGCSWDLVSSECINRRDCGNIWNRTNCNGYFLGCTGGDKECSTLSGSSTCDDIAGCGGACEGPCCEGTAVCSVADCFSGCSKSCNNLSGSSSGICSPDSCGAECTTSCAGTLSCEDITSQSACGAVAGCSWTSSNTTPWRTLLVGGERGGGDLYFALDVTDPDSPTLQWEYSVLRNMVHLQSTSANTYKAVAPFRNKSVYDSLKIRPLSWSTPYVGYFSLPASLRLKAEANMLFPWSPDSAVPDCTIFVDEASCIVNDKCSWSGSSCLLDSIYPLDPVDWGGAAHPLPGWYAFIGGGIHIYDKGKLLPDCGDFTLQPECDAAGSRCTWDGSICSALAGDDIREHIYEPFLLMLDIQSGINIFQYSWPMLQQAFKSQWPAEEIDGRQIPNAMSTPVVLDLWNHQWWPQFCAGFQQFRSDGTTEECGAVSGCSWDANLNICKKTVCDTASTIEGCRNTSGCIWEDGLCNEKPFFGKDGELDHIMMGDLSGALWGIRFTNETSGDQRMIVDRWNTKKAVSNCSAQGNLSDCEDNGCWWDGIVCQEGYGYRGSKQPVTVTPIAAFDHHTNLHLYYGSGKFDDAVGDASDRTDQGTMSFYNVSLPVDRYISDTDTVCTVSDASGLANVSINCAAGSDAIKIDNSSATSDLLIRLRTADCATECSGTSDSWTVPPAPDDPDCFAEYQGAPRPDGCGMADNYNCGNSCYSCILDLQRPGEKITSDALVAGDLVFFTTFLPEDEVCSGGGEGYLYIVDYLCRELGENPFDGSGLDSDYRGASTWSDDAGFDPQSEKARAFRSSLGSGMPSRPVLDSSGERVIIQTSDATIHRVKLKMPQKPFYLQGWRER